MTAIERAFAPRPGSPIYEEDCVVVYECHVINDVEYKLYFNKAKEWCVRVCDPDTKEWLCPVHMFPVNQDVEAMDYFTGLLLKAHKSCHTA